MPGAPAGGAAMGGCCVGNACGIDGALFGRGCIENTEAVSVLGTIPLIGSLITIPPQLACDRPIVEVDAGPEDAGL
jgi:hypothetical protein